MRHKAIEERGPLELIEEAFYLIRAAPGAGLVAYYLGSLPFVLGLLFFWSDMARSAFAEQRLLPGSLSLGCAFLWMKTWQAIAVRHWQARLCGEPPPRWRLRWLGHIAAHQAILQALGLFLLPLGFVLMLPFGWILAFFNNATLFSAGTGAKLRSVWQRSWSQALLWPMQNHNVILILALFALAVFFNLYSGLLGIPFLLDRLLGLPSVFTQSPTAAMNSTVTAAIGGLTYLCCDPLVKAVYVLRCFYGESLKTGQDLRAELRSVADASRSAAVALLLLVAWLGGAAAALAAPANADLERAASAPASGPGTVAPAAMDRSIDRIIQQREYSWRWPRETAPASQREGWAAWIDQKLTQLLKAAGREVADLWDALRRLWSKSGVPSPSGSVMAYTAYALFLVLIVALLGLLGWTLYRLWRSYQTTVEVPAAPLPAAPDVEDENVGADQLPEDGWMRLAGEFMARGDLRLALRALFLATLAHLAEQNLITLARFKSNRDYEQELARRGHALAAVRNLFSQNLALFERVWYGRHALSAQMVQEFSTNVDRMKTI